MHFGSTRVLWRRGVAQLYDGAVVAAAGFGAVVAVGTGALEGPAFSVVSIIAASLNWLVLQGLTGWTAGKWLAGIRTVDVDARAPGTRAAFKRTLPLLIESLGLVAAVAIYRDRNGQRFGDRWAGTYVVRAPRTGGGVRPASRPPAV